MSVLTVRFQSLHPSGSSAEVEKAVPSMLSPYSTVLLSPDIIFLQNIFSTSEGCSAHTEPFAVWAAVLAFFSKAFKVIALATKWKFISIFELGTVDHVCTTRHGSHTYFPLLKVRTVSRVSRLVCLSGMIRVSILYVGPNTLDAGTLARIGGRMTQIPDYAIEKSRGIVVKPSPNSYCLTYSPAEGTSLLCSLTSEWLCRGVSKYLLLRPRTFFSQYQCIDTRVETLPRSDRRQGSVSCHSSSRPT